MLDEAGMMGEVVGLAVLEDEEAAFLKQITRKDDVGEFGDLRQDVWRVGKDEVELLTALRDELQGIASDGECRCVL